MKTVALGAVASAAMALSGCGYAHGQDGGGPRVERSYQVGPFRQIETAGSYDVEVSTGGAPGVTASGPKNAIDRLVVEVSGDKLLIHPQNHGFFTIGGWNGPMVVHVTAPTPVSAASTAGSGDLHIDRVDGGSFVGSVGGSGDLTIDQASTQNLKLTLAGSGDIRARSGQSGNVEYSTAGSGGIDARGVRAQSATVNAIGSGDIAGQVSGTANVSMTGSGDVTLTGGAKCTVSKAGSGDVNCS
jgi:hypothetical protein